MNNNKRILIIITIFIILGISYFLSSMGFEKSQETKQEETENDLSYYENEEVGFSFYYPSDLKSTNFFTEEGFNVQISDISPYQEGFAPSGYTLENVLKHKEALEKGNLGGIEFDFYKNRELIKICNNLYAEVDYSFRSATFVKRVTFFINDYMVQISLMGNGDSIIKENSQYFQNSSDHYDFKEGRQDIFMEDLKNNNISDSLEKWIDSFNTAVESITIY